MLAHSDLYARDGKSQHAFCIDIDRDGDVRVLCNVEPSERWMDTMLHEFGHAIYDRECDHTLPWLLRGAAHALTTEGIAMLMGRLPRDADWLVVDRRASATTCSTTICAPRSLTSQRAALLVFARWVLVMTTFERALYADPDGDLDTLWWDLVERYQLGASSRRPPRARLGVEDPPRGRARLLPELPLRRAVRVAARTPRSTTRAGGLVDEPAAGELLVRDVFAPGRVDALGRPGRSTRPGEPLSAPRTSRAELRG